MAESSAPFFSAQGNHSSSDCPKYRKSSVPFRQGPSLAIPKRVVLFVLIAMPVVFPSGCMVPRGQYETLRSRNLAVTDKYEALKKSYRMLQEHSRGLEDRLCETETQLDRLESRVGFDQQELADRQEANALLEEQIEGLISNNADRSIVSAGSRSSPLRGDSFQNGPVEKLGNDILFQPGSDRMRPGAEQILAQLARKLNSPEGKDLRVLLVGHTDAQKIVNPEARNRYRNNFRLSTARANLVAEFLRKQGIEKERIGIAGFGGHQPIASNSTEQQRSRNRRVEVFLCGRRVPVLGWTETIPQLY